MKLAILSSRFPYPIEKGDKLRLFYQIKSLAENHEIHLISLYENDEDILSLSVLEEICSSVHVFKLKKAKKLLRVSRAFITGNPFQVHYFYDPKIAQKISELIGVIAPESIYCQLIRMSEYVKDLDYPKVLDYMDCFSMNYSKRAKLEKLPLKLFFKSEASRLKQYELKMAHAFEGLTIISSRDAGKIRSDRKLEVISNGIDTKFFTPIARRADVDVLFVGNMGYHPNIIAARFLVHQVVSLLEESCTVKIAGARPSASVKALAAENVHVTGWVDDIRLAYAGAKVFVAPIFSGAGQQNKILEAMSMGMICITTSIVNEAIGAKDGEHLLLADSEVEFAELIDDVLNHIDRYQNIKKAAREFVEKHFSWEVENKKLNEIIIKSRKEKLNEG